MNDLDLPKLIRESLDQKQYQEEHWEGTFQQYLDLVTDNPLVVRTAHQRLYDMVLSYGVKEIERDKTKMLRYVFFEDPMEDGRDALFGSSEPTMDFGTGPAATAPLPTVSPAASAGYAQPAPSQTAPLPHLEPSAGRAYQQPVAPAPYQQPVAPAPYQQPVAPAPYQPLPTAPAYPVQQAYRPAPCRPSATW